MSQDERTVGTEETYVPDPRRWRMMLIGLVGVIVSRVVALLEPSGQQSHALRELGAVLLRTPRATERFRKGLS